MTQTTTPTAGAMRAAKRIHKSHMEIEGYAAAIDEEMPTADLLEACKTLCDVVAIYARPAIRNGELNGDAAKALHAAFEAIAKAERP